MASEFQFLGHDYTSAADDLAPAEMSLLPLRVAGGAAGR
jgi:hypothetical protein